MTRTAIVLALALTGAPALLRGGAGGLERPCRPAGRGVAPRHWLGCSPAEAPSRDLDDAERLLVGLPVDPNRASATALAHVPGLSWALAREAVADREAGGPFRSVEELVRVRGIGPKRLAAARRWLAVDPVPVGMAIRAEER